MLDFFQNGWNELVVIRWDQPLNYLYIPVLVLYVGVAAALLRWGRLSEIGALDLKHGDRHNYGIEGIRGPLAFFVLIAHFLSTQKTLIDGGFGRIFAEHERLASTAGLAVCYFFAITGYLFWKKFLVSPNTNIALMFYGRIARILPAFLAVCIVSLALIGITDPAAFMAPFATTLHGAFSLFTLGHYDATFSRWVLLDVGPTWTLFWEFLFYALLPFLFAARRLIGPVLFHLAVPVLLSFWNPGHELLFIWVGTVVAEAAEVMDGRTLLIDRCLHFVAPAIFAYSFLRGEFAFSPWYGIETGIVVLALARRATFGGILSWTALQALGRVGYSTYLFHGLVIHASIFCTAAFVDFATLGHVGLLLYFLCLLPVMILVSALAFRYLERPFMASSTARRMETYASASYLKSLPSDPR